MRNILVLIAWVLLPLVALQFIGSLAASGRFVVFTQVPSIVESDAFDEYDLAPSVSSDSPSHVHLVGYPKFSQSYDSLLKCGYIHQHFGIKCASPRGPPKARS